MKKRVLLMASVALTLLLVAGVAWAATIQCKPGSNAPEPCRGTSEDDLMRGNPGGDRIESLAGNDKIFAYDGRDVILAGTGQDVVSAGPKNDTIYDGQGTDEVQGGTGSDTFNGGWGNDELQGGADRDYIYDKIGINVYFGGPGDDLIDSLERRRGSSFPPGYKQPDEVTCGQGDDYVRANLHDVVAEDCETVAGQYQGF